LLVVLFFWIDLWFSVFGFPDNFPQGKLLVGEFFEIPIVLDIYHTFIIGIFAYWSSDYTHSYSFITLISMFTAPLIYIPLVQGHFAGGIFNFENWDDWEKAVSITFIVFTIIAILFELYLHYKRNTLLFYILSIGFLIVFFTILRSFPIKPTQALKNIESQFPGTLFSNEFPMWTAYLSFTSLFRLRNMVSNIFSGMFLSLAIMNQTAILFS